jgi:hypothetical protein
MLRFIVGSSLECMVATKKIPLESIKQTIQQYLQEKAGDHFPYKQCAPAYGLELTQVFY